MIAQIIGANHFFFVRIGENFFLYFVNFDVTGRDTGNHGIYYPLFSQYLRYILLKQ